MPDVKFSDVVKNLMDKLNALSVVIVSRDGLMLAGEVPAGVYSETFSIMAATILGAAVTATSEFTKTAPNKITIESTDLTLVIMSAGKKLLLCVSVPSKMDLSKVYKEMEQAIKQISS